MKIIKYLSLFLVIIIAFTLIGLGFYLNTLASSEYIVEGVIDRTSYLFKNYLDKNKIDLSDKFVLKSNIDIKIDSELYRNLSTTNEEYIKKTNYFRNLSNTKSEFVWKQDFKGKKAYFSFFSRLVDENLINYKKFVDDSTEYNYLEGVTSSYINMGNSVYFENLNSERKMNDNLDYLYNAFLNSLKKRLGMEEFERYEVIESINGNRMRVNQLALKIDDKFLKRVLNGVKDDLKNDSVSNSIITGINKNFFKSDIFKKDKFLKGDGTYTFNIYTSPLLNRPLKLELVYMEGTSKKFISYDGDEKRGNINYVENDKLIYNVDCKFGVDEYQFDIKDSSLEKIGSFKIDSELRMETFSLLSEIGNKKVDLNYTSKYVESDEYNVVNDKKLVFNVVEDKMQKYNGEIHLITTFSKNSEINEDISNAVLESSLSKEEKDIFSNKKTLVMERLER